jgi:ATP/ADP translocase
VAGSSYVAIVVPIMAFITMAFWLGLVFYADSHPGYGHRKSRRRTQKTA